MRAKPASFITIEVSGNVIIDAVVLLAGADNATDVIADAIIDWINESQGLEGVDFDVKVRSVTDGVIP